MTNTDDYILVVGGRIDGQFWPVDRDRLKIPQLRSTPMVLFTDEPSIVEIEYDSYHIEHFYTPTKKFRFWLLDGLTPEDLVHRLIGSYVPMEPHK